MKRKLAGLFLTIICVFALAITIILSLSALGEIRLLKNQITLYSSSFEKTYNGEYVTYDELTITSGSLKYGDKIVYDNSDIALEAGIYNIAPIYHIEDKKGNDVTESYDIIEDFGTLVINKKIVNLYTSSAFFTSDDMVRQITSGAYIEGIATNDSYSLYDFVYPIKGSIINNTCSYLIHNDKYDLDVTSSYDVHGNYGYLFWLNSSTINAMGDGDYIVDEDSNGNSNSNDDNKKEDDSIGSIKDSDLTLNLEGSNSERNLYIAKIKTKYESHNLLSENIQTDYDPTTGALTHNSKINISSYTYNPNTYIYNQLKSSPLKENNVTITYLSKENRDRDIYIPYTNEFNKHSENIYDNDAIFSSLNEEQISFSFYDYNFTSNPSLLYSLSFNDEKMKNEEEKYYKEVTKKYLTVPSSMKSQIDKFILNYNLPALSENVNESDIYKAIKYVFNTYFTYNTEPGWEFSDFVSYFLNVAKVGYCTHFASSGMLILRELGIPARVVMGHGYDTYGDYIETFNNSVGHAWTEMYIKGHGWVKVDFTISGNLPYSEEETKDDDDKRPEIKIITASENKEYDGTPLTRFGYSIKGNLKSNHKIYIENNASIIDSGAIENSCSYIILDNNGNDVTSEYKIKENYGTLLVTKKSISASSLDCTVKLSLKNKEPIIKVDGLDNGMSYKSTIYMDEIKVNGEYKEYFLINNIYNAKKEDITHNFIINYNYGMMKVI